MVKNFVADSNAAAQEKGLEATLAFVENCDLAGETVNEVVYGLVSKCLASPKSRTRDLSKQVLVLVGGCILHSQVIVMKRKRVNFTHLVLISNL